MVWSYIVYLQSFSTYSAIQETSFLTLPQPAYIRQLSRKISDRERYVILQLNEIYVDQRLTYKSGDIFRASEIPQHG